jgi:hypothetical protein
MSSKHYKVLITLPDLAAAHAEQEVRVVSSTWAGAMKLACEQVSKRPHVFGKHIKSAKIHFTVIDCGDLTDSEPERSRQNHGQESRIQGLLFEL